MSYGSGDEIKRNKNRKEGFFIEWNEGQVEAEESIEVEE